MKPIVTLLAALLGALTTASSFAADLSKITSRAELDTVISDVYRSVVPLCANMSETTLIFSK